MSNDKFVKLKPITVALLLDAVFATNVGVVPTFFVIAFLKNVELAYFALLIFSEFWLVFEVIFT